MLGTEPENLELIMASFDKKEFPRLTGLNWPTWKRHFVNLCRGNKVTLEISPERDDFAEVERRGSKTILKELKTEKSGVKLENPARELNRDDEDREAREYLALEFMLRQVAPEIL